MTTEVEILRMVVYYSPLAAAIYLLFQIAFTEAPNRVARLVFRFVPLVLAVLLSVPYFNLVLKSMKLGL